MDNRGFNLLALSEFDFKEDGKLDKTVREVWTYDRYGNWVADDYSVFEPGTSNLLSHSTTIRSYIHRGDIVRNSGHDPEGPPLFAPEFSADPAMYPALRRPHAPSSAVPLTLHEFSNRRFGFRLSAWNRDSLDNSKSQ